MYFNHLKRLIQIDKYPMFRTVKMRYVLLHILMLAMLLSMFNISNAFTTFQTVAALTSAETTSIPDFKVVDGILKIEKEHSLKLNDVTVTFSPKQKSPAQNHITLDKDEILLSNTTRVKYSNINMFQDKASLIQFLNTFTNSIYFYFIIYALLLLSTQYFLITVKIIAVSALSHIAARLFNRKSRYMNWLKINTFIYTLPTLILMISVSSNIQDLSLISWILMFILICVTIYYLPKQKHKAKQN